MHWSNFEKISFIVTYKHQKKKKGHSGTCWNDDAWSVFIWYFFFRYNLLLKILKLPDAGSGPSSAFFDNHSWWMLTMKTFKPFLLSWSHRVPLALTMVRFLGWHQLSKQRIKTQDFVLKWAVGYASSSFYHMCAELDGWWWIDQNGMKMGCKPHTDGTELKHGALCPFSFGSSRASRSFKNWSSATLQVSSSSSSFRQGSGIATILWTLMSSDNFLVILK